MYADDTTVYSIGENVDQAVAQLNKALEELYTWCLNNRLTPHPVKCGTFLVSRSSFVGPIAPVLIGDSFVNQVNKSRLLGTVVDNKLSWTPHLMDLKKRYAIKLALLKRCKFLPKKVLEAFYLTVILPTVTYGLPLWGCCSNKELFNSVEKLHSTAAKIIFNLGSDTPHTEALKIANWHPLCYKYKIALVKLMHKAHWENLSLPLCDNIICRRTSTYPSRTPDSASVPRFNSRFVHFSIRYRGAALWNNTLANGHSIVDASCKTLSTKLKDNVSFLNFNFYATSISTTDFSDHDYVYF